MTTAFSSHKIQSLRALHDSVVVSDMEFDQRQLSSGIILLNDNGTSAGIRPRWGRVYAIGPDHKDVKPGQWILVAHGRWTRGIKIEDANGEHTIRKIDANDILLVSDQDPGPNDTMSDAIQPTSQNRF